VATITEAPHQHPAGGLGNPYQRHVLSPGAPPVRPRVGQQKGPRTVFVALQILTVLTVSVAMSKGLAHALELPGKRLLPKETFLAVQPIYYPGFTVGGMVGEFGGMLTTFILLLVTPRSTTSFWLTLVALIALLAMHAAYWLLTHPVNNFWLREVKLRDRWENSHLIRAMLGFVALALLVAAVAFRP
jgi:hypothetical protein